MAHCSSVNKLGEKEKSRETGPGNQTEKIASDSRIFPSAVMTTRNIHLLSFLWKQVISACFLLFMSIQYYLGANLST